MGAASSALIGLAIAIAFSPILADLALDYPENRAGRLGLIAAAAYALRMREAPATRRPGLGIAAIGAGLLLELVCLVAQIWVIGRIGLALAVVGWAFLRGAPSLRAAPLAFAAIPIPIVLLSIGSPVLETNLARLAAVPWQAIGADVVASGGLLRTADASMQLLPVDAGLALALAGAALGWFSTLDPPVSVALVATRVLSGALLGALSQLALLGVAAGLVAFGAPEPARSLLDWAGLVAGALALFWLSARRGAAG